MDDLCVSGPAAVQLAYHLRMAVAFAAAGNQAECAAESTLAWALLCTHEKRSSELVAELPGPSVAGASSAQWDALQRSSQTLASSLQAHYVSEGQHETAAMYASAATSMGTLFGDLRRTD